MNIRFPVLPACVAVLAMPLAYTGAWAAEDAAPAPRVCVATQQISSWRALDDGNVVVTTAPGKDYKVTFVTPCQHLKWSVFVRVNTRPTGGTMCLSRGDVMLFGRGARHSDDSFADEESCLVQTVAPYVPPPPPPKPAG